MDMTKRHRWNIFIDLVILLILWLVTFDWISLAHPGIQIVIRGVSIIGAILWIVIRVRSTRPFQLPKVVIPIAVYLLLQILSTFRSPLPFHALELTLTNLFIFIAFIFAIDRLDIGWDPIRWENAMLGTTILFSILNLLITIIWFKTWWDISGSVISPPPYGFRLPGGFLQHANIEAAFINLVLPIVLVRLFQAPSKLKRLLSILALLLILTIEYFTSSRGGWLAAIAGIITTCGLIFSPYLRRGINRFSFKPKNDLTVHRRVFVLILFSIVLCAVGMLFLRQAQTTEHAPIESARTNIFKTAWNVFDNSPIWGHGKGSMHVLSAVEDQLPPGFYIIHAHNLLLEIGAEAGIIGILLLMFAGFLFLRAFLQAWKRSSMEKRNSLAAYAGVFAGFAVHHQVDIPLEAPIYMLSLSIFVALVYKLAPPREKFSIRRVWMMPALVFLMLIYLAGSCYTLRGSQMFYRGIMAANEDEWQYASDLICQSSEINPEFSFYFFQCGLAKAFSYQESGDEQELIEAVASLEEGLDMDPYWPVHWANIATLEWEAGQKSQAVNHMRRALEAAPRNPLFALNLGWMEEQNNNHKEAISAYREASRLDPWLIRTIFFTDTDIRRMVAQEQTLEVYQHPSYQNVWEGWRKLDDSNLEDSKQHFELTIELDPRNAKAYAGLAVIYQLLGNEEHAWQNIQTAVFADSSSPFIQHIAGRVAYQQGREMEATRHFDRAYSLIQTKSYSSGYYAGVYRKAFLASDLVPQFKRADLTPEMVEDFIILAEYWAQNGDEEKAGKILDFISH